MGRGGEKKVWDSVAWWESKGVREEEKREREQWGDFSDVQTAGYTSELMLPQKAIFSSQAPHPLRR